MEEASHVDLGRGKKRSDDEGGLRTVFLSIFKDNEGLAEA